MVGSQVSFLCVVPVIIGLPHDSSIKCIEIRCYSVRLSMFATYLSQMGSAQANVHHVVLAALLHVFEIVQILATTMTATAACYLGTCI